MQVKTFRLHLFAKITKFIEISTAGAVYQLESNRTSTALTWLIFAFSIAAIRGFAFDAVPSFQFLR